MRLSVLTVLAKFVAGVALEFLAAACLEVVLVPAAALAHGRSVWKRGILVLQEHRF